MKRTIALLLSFAWMLLPQSAHACTACANQYDPASTQAIRIAVLTLLVIITFVLICFGAFFLRLRRLAANASQA